ncbi:MAG: 4-oxalocrotonate tautomerase [archaeon]|nr:4-oxalocrotonate tautomerase [archaeon]
MPNVVIDGPVIKDIEVKRTLNREVTEALEKAYKLDKRAFVIFIKENSPENVGFAGELMIDMHKSS